MGDASFCRESRLDSNEENNGASLGLSLGTIAVRFKK